MHGRFNEVDFLVKGRRQIGIRIRRSPELNRLFLATWCQQIGPIPRVSLLDQVRNHRTQKELEIPLYPAQARLRCRAFFSPVNPSVCLISSSRDLRSNNRIDCRFDECIKTCVRKFRQFRCPFFTLISGPGDAKVEFTCVSRSISNYI